MPILRSPEEVALRIGLTVNGRTPTAADPKFRAMLESATARIENMLSTQLGFATRSDTFEVSCQYSSNTEVFRLAAGFVTPNSVVVTDPSGEVANSDRYRVNYELGTVTISRPCSGEWVVVYTAGFQAGEGDPAVYIAVPDWMLALVDLVALGWLRLVSAEKTPTTVAYSSMMSAIYREVAAQTYGRYDRPRSPALFPIDSQVTS